MLVVVAHCPFEGVNVYVAVVVLLTVVGDHVPVIPFVEVVGKTGAIDPLHMGPTVVNVGTTLESTFTERVVLVAHCPGAAVKVYVADVVLLTVAGDHVPVIPLFEVVGKIGDGDPEQIGFIAVNVGVMLELTVTSNVVVLAHCAAFGVNV
jgi:hypothetical protein